LNGVAFEIFTSYMQDILYIICQCEKKPGEMLFYLENKHHKMSKLNREAKHQAEDYRLSNTILRKTGLNAVTSEGR
jgi:hypothetical protein